jgi:hypothetical protein
MLRFTLTAVVLAAAVATVHPASTDPLAATASYRDQAQVAGQPVAPAPALSRSSDSDGSALKAGRSNEFIPVGIGWG